MGQSVSQFTEQELQDYQVTLSFFSFSISYSQIRILKPYFYYPFQDLTYFTKKEILL